MERAEYERMYELEDSYWWFVSRRYLTTALIQKWVTLLTNDYILDVGCGTGGNLKSLVQWAETTGIDLSPIALDLARCRKLPRLAQASALTLPYSDDTFRLVTAFDVLYHRWVTSDDRAIHECYRVLRPGGWLLLTDSALPALWSSHDEIYYARQRYALQDIRQKLAEAGFKPHLCSYINMLLLPIMVVVRLLPRWFGSVSNSNRLSSLPIWLNQWLISIQNLELRWLLRGRTFPIGSSLVCLVQKPLDGDYGN